jgi:hypothetical protein
MGESVHIMEKPPEALLVASKGTVLKVNADKTKYMFMSLDQGAGRSQYVKINDSSFERVGQLRYVGATYSYQ